MSELFLKISKPQSLTPGAPGHAFYRIDHATELYEETKLLHTFIYSSTYAMGTNYCDSIMQIMAMPLPGNEENIQNPRS